MFVHLAIHYPKPEHSDDLLASMRRVDAAAAGAPGLIQMGAWRDARSDRLVGLAIWESREAFLESVEKIFEAVADDPIIDWSTRPPDSFHLSPAGP
jgi:heme-degrading monooxygenase HmoA